MVNKAFCEATGYARADVIGNIPERLGIWHSETDRQALRERLLTERQVTGHIAKMRHASGKQLTAEISFSLVNIGGAPLLLSVGRDITDQLRMKEALHKQALIFENMQDTVVITDLNHSIVDVNPATLKAFGYSREELVGRLPTVFLSTERRNPFSEIVSELEKNRSWAGEVDATDRSGKHLVWDLRIVPLSDEEGTFVGHIGIGRDLTEKRSLEEQYRHAQKMEAIGRLAGSVAHDFNNVLAVISGYAELASMIGGTSEKLQEHLRAIREATTKAVNVTRQLLTFSRKDLVEPVTMELDQVLADLFKLVGRVLGQDITLDLSLGAKGAFMLADKGQIEQAIINLAVNARDAMPGGGTLRIRTSVCEIAAKHYLVCEVEDSGTGMTEDVKQHIFEPFFTTKSEGKGTGLGLSTVYGIVKKASGFIEVNTAVGQGTTFRLCFPQAFADRLRKKADTNDQVAPTGTERVLLVEDEQSLLEATTQFLVTLGYDVHQASCGQEALALVGDMKDPVDVLITDLQMPGGISGEQIRNTLGEKNALLRTIYVSGNHQNELTGKLSRSEMFLQKPFRFTELAQTIRNLLDDSGGNKEVKDDEQRGEGLSAGR